MSTAATATATWARARRVVLIAATGLAAGALTWLLSSFVIGRAAAARLPPPPGPDAVPPAAGAAIAAADTAARRWPSAASIAELAMTYHANLRPAEALQGYAIAASLAAGDWRWPYYRGLLLEERGDQAGAAEAFATVSRLTSHGLAHFHLAEIAFKAGRLDAAEAGYQAAQQADSPAPPAGPDGLPPRRAIPFSAYLRLGLARVQVERGNRRDGGDQLAALVRDHPEFGSAHALLRQVRADGARPGPDEGRAYVPPADPWLDAIVVRSWHTDMLLKQAAISGRTGDTAWREWLVGRALTASPQGLDVLLEAAATARAASRLDQALGYLRQAEAVAPDNHLTLVEQGRTLSDLGRLVEAEAVLRRAIRVRDATAEYNLANVLDQLNRWDEAREHYNRAVAINPFHTQALNNLGIGFSRRGQPEQAVLAYRRAIAVAPDEVGSYTNLSAALGALGRYAEALEATEAAIKLAPDAADAHSNRGIALTQLGRRHEARAAFEAALRLVPTHANARRNLAILNRPY